jgi:hypothetical protein
MWALERPWSLRRGSVLADTPLALIAALGGTWLAISWLAGVGWLPGAIVRVVALTAMHGSLLAVALAWAEVDSGGRLPPGSLAIMVLLVGAGALATLDPRAAFALAGAPVWLAILAVRGHLTALGLGPGVPLRPMLVGASIGALLGGHLLFSAAQTLGYPLRGGAWPALLVAWAYDLGANVISAECFFRGALFNRLQRRWSFGSAAAVATVFTLIRYLSDPVLPPQIEVMVGVLFYVTALGVVNCWLLWWSGSLVPGLIAAALFFLAYRAVAVG